MDYYLETNRLEASGNVVFQGPEAQIAAERVEFDVGAGTGLIATISDPRGGAVLVSRVLGNGLVCAGIGALIDAAQRLVLHRRVRRSPSRGIPLVVLVGIFNFLFVAVMGSQQSEVRGAA